MLNNNTLITGIKKCQVLLLLSADWADAIVSTVSVGRDILSFSQNCVIHQYNYTTNTEANEIQNRIYIIT